MILMSQDFCIPQQHRWSLSPCSLPHHQPSVSKEAPIGIFFSGGQLSSLDTSRHIPSLFHRSLTGPDSVWNRYLTVWLAPDEESYCPLHQESYAKEHPACSLSDRPYDPSFTFSPAPGLSSSTIPAALSLNVSRIRNRTYQSMIPEHLCRLLHTHPLHIGNKHRFTMMRVDINPFQHAEYHDCHYHNHSGNIQPEKIYLFLKRKRIL